MTKQGEEARTREAHRLTLRTSNLRDMSVTGTKYTGTAQSAQYDTASRRGVHRKLLVKPRATCMAEGGRSDGPSSAKRSAQCIRTRTSTSRAASTYRARGDETWRTRSPAPQQQEHPAER